MLHLPRRCFMRSQVAPMSGGMLLRPMLRSIGLTPKFFSSRGDRDNVLGEYEELAKRRKKMLDSQQRAQMVVSPMVRRAAEDVVYSKIYSDCESDSDIEGSPLSDGEESRMYSCIYSDAELSDGMPNDDKK